MIHKHIWSDETKLLLIEQKCCAAIQLIKQKRFSIRWAMAYNKTSTKMQSRGFAWRLRKAFPSKRVGRKSGKSKTHAEDTHAETNLHTNVVLTNPGFSESSFRKRLAPAPGESPWLGVEAACAWIICMTYLSRIDWLFIRGSKWICGK